MLKTTVGQLLINDALPEEMRDYSREYDKKTLNTLLEQVAQQHPEKYREISFKLGDLGRKFAHEQGGFSFGAEHLLKSKAAQAIQDEVRGKIKTILANDQLTPTQRREQIVLAVGREQDRLQKAVMQEALDNKNPLAFQVVSGTRGKPMNLASLMGSDMLYADHRDRPIPIPVLRSYAQGLSQAEYWAGTYGARKGVLATKFCLAKGTLVLMADFTQKPIEQVEPGEAVFTLDDQDRLIQTRVVRRYNNGLRPCSTFYFREGRSPSLVEVTATDNHKIYVEHRLAADLVPREMAKLGLLSPVCHAAVVPVDAKSAADERPVSRRYAGYIVRGELPTYDLEVEHPSHRFVLANMLVVSNSTAQAGFLGKQLAAAAHRLVVTGEDEEDEFEEDSPRGFPVEADDPDSAGALLAVDTGPYKRNTVLTPKIIKHLKRLGKNQFLVRSPAVGGAADGGLYARDVGVRERGNLPGRGEVVGMTAANALAEPVAQGQLCLGVGTLVRMADGRVRPIEEIRFGDMVLGADKDGNTFPVRVVNRFYNGEKDCVRTEFWCAKRQQFVRLVSTEDHKVLGVKYWRNSRFTEGVLPVGDNCDVFYARMPHTYVRRMSQEPVGKVATFDIEVEHEDHLFVLENGLIVSNSAKHSGGVAGQEKSVSGFDLLNQLIQVPKKMRGGAAHALADGQVDSIEPAPAGGFNLVIEGKKHYVPAGLDLRVKVGDTVEAGDMLSNGVPNPALIVEHKGVGEGRRYFVNEYRKAMQEGGMPANRRNVELLARGLINHVQLTDEYEDYVPDDIIPYSSIEKSWKPRNDAEQAEPNYAVGKYLERPVLHYTIGTKVQPSMVKQFEQFGVKRLVVHKEPPPFQPHMVRGMYQMQHDPDWMTQMYGSGLKKSLLTSTARGATSDTTGTSFVPSLALGKDFGNVPGRAVRSPQPGFTPPKVPLPDPNLLSYKEAAETTGVDTTKSSPASSVSTPPAAPANPLPIGSRAPSFAPTGGLIAGAEQLRNMNAGGALRAPDMNRWRRQPGVTPDSAAVPKIIPQAGPAPEAAPSPAASPMSTSLVGAPKPFTASNQTAPRPTNLPSLLSAVGAARWGIDPIINATSSWLSSTPTAGAVVNKGIQVGSKLAPVASRVQQVSQVAQATPVLRHLVPAARVIPGGVGGMLSKANPYLTLGIDAAATGNDIYRRGFTATSDEHIDHLQRILDGEYGAAGPVHMANAALQPIRTTTAFATPPVQLAANAWRNFTGSDEQIKDRTVSSEMLNSRELPKRIDSSISALARQLAAETDSNRRAAMQNQLGRYQVLRNAYDQNAGMLGTGQFGTMLTNNLQGMKDRLAAIEQELKAPNLDTAKAQDLMNHQQRLRSDINTYHDWLQ